MATATQRVQNKRGTKSTLPTTGTLPGELYLPTDSKTIHVGNAAGSTYPATPSVIDLQQISTGVQDVDLLMLTDVSENGQKEKKITVADFKDALNIPPASTDEKVALNSGKTAYYLDEIIVTDDIHTRHIQKVTSELRVPDGKITFDIKNGAIFTDQLAGDTSHTPLAQGFSGDLLMSKGDGSFAWANVIDCGTW